MQCCMVRWAMQLAQADPCSIPIQFFCAARYHAFTYTYRKPKSSHRPTFTQLVEMLSRADFELFVWKEQDLRDTDPRVKDIGAPLEVAEKLYLDIQNMYK